MNKFLGAIAALDKAVQHLLILLMAVLLVDVSWQVVTRFVLPQPSSFTEELARFLLIWIGLLGSAHAYRHKMHLGIDLFSNKLSTPNRRRMNQLVQIIVMIFALAVLVYGGSKLVMLAYYLNQMSASMQINMGLVYSVLPISGILFCIYAIEQFCSPELPLNVQTEADQPIPTEGN